MTYQPICPNHENNGIQHYKMSKDKAVVKSIAFETTNDGMQFYTLVKATIAIPCECRICGNTWEEILEISAEKGLTNNQSCGTIISFQEK